jgi:ribosomal protein S27E
MLPRTVSCESCGKTAFVRAYGRLEYDWDQPGEVDAAVRIKSIELTVDCPDCGVLRQVYHPDSGADASRHRISL